MKSKPTPHTHTGVTARELTVEFGPTGRLKHTITVPEGTGCKKLDGGSNPWVVSDLAFIANKSGSLYSDADVYGILIPEGEIAGITEVENRQAIQRPRG